MELLGRERSRERSGSAIMEDFELIKALDSSRQDEVKEVTAIMKDMLATYKEPWLLNTLVDYYFETGSNGALEIVKGIKQIQAQNFFEKLHNSLLKCPSIQLKSLMLLANVINEQAGWLYQIVDTLVFMTIVKLLKVSTNMTILMSAVLTLTALLPLAPSYIAHHLPDLFEVFSRLAAWRSGSYPTVPEVHLLHLDVAVYYYFVQLYTMYPCNFMDYLKARYGPKGELYIFKRHIAPLLKHVRMHPELVYQSTDYEKEKIKWCTMEPDEIAALSSDVSLDPLKGSQDVDSQSLQSLSLSAETSLKQKLDTISHLPMEATDEAKAPIKAVKNHENDSLSQHKVQWPKVTVSRVSSSKSNELYGTRRTGHKRRHSYSDSSELPNYIPMVQTGDTKFSPSVLLGLHPPIADQQLSRHSSYISTASSGTTTTSLASPFCSDTTHTHNPLHNYSPTASVTSYSMDAPLQSSCTSEDSAADMFRYPDFSRSLPSSVSMNLTAGKPGKNLVSSMTVIEKQNPLKAAVNRLIGIISRRSSDQQKSSSQSQSRSATQSPSGSCNCNYDELSDDKLLNDEVEVAVEALQNETVRSVEPVRRTLLLSEETTKDSSIDRELTPSIESQDSTNYDSCTEQPVDRHHHPVTKKSKSFPDAGEAAEEVLSPQDRLRMLLNERKSSEQPQSHEHLNSVPPLLTNLGPAAKKYANRKRSHSITWAIGGDSIRSDMGKPKRTFHQHTSNSESSDNIMTDDSCSSTPLNDMSTRCISHNTLVSLDSASTLVPGSPTASQPDLQDLTLSESYPEPQKRSLCLSCQYHHSNGGKSKDSHVVHNSMSPLDTLDQYIRSGGRLHHYTSMNVPLTSFEYVDWDHFGGCPHQEAVSVMADQVMLLHSQLLFERNQCLQHATRNRRLLSMMHQSGADKEDMLAMRDQVHIMEQTVESKDINIGILKEKLRQLTDEIANKEESLNKHLRTLVEEKQRQDSDNRRLHEKVQKLEAYNATLEKELMSANSKIFNLEARLKQSEPLLQYSKELQAQVESLNRKLLVVNEVHHHQQSADSKRRKGAASHQYEMMCGAYKRERDVALAKVDELSQQLQEMNMKFDELHNKMKSKDEKILTLEKSIGTVKERCAAKLKMNEDSYNTIKSTCKQQESYILELQGQVEKHSQVCHKHCCSNLIMAESNQ